MNVDQYLAHLVDVIEGPQYTNDPNDPGGPTKYGVTQAALTKYRGRPVTPKDVQALTRDEALDLYRRDYVTAPHFDQVAAVSVAVALECIDTGVIMPVTIAVTFLQRSLNALNHNGSDWQDLRVDGDCGPRTIEALRALVLKRGRVGIVMLLKMLNCLQGARYIENAEKDPAKEEYMFGWFQNRVQLDPNSVFYGVR